MILNILEEEQFSTKQIKTGFVHVLCAGLGFFYDFLPINGRIINMFVSVQVKCLKLAKIEIFMKEKYCIIFKKSQVGLFPLFLS